MGRQSDLKLSEAYDGQVCTLALEGVLDAFAVEPLAKQIEAIFRQRCYRVCLDLSRVSNVSSAGVGVLLSMASQARSNGGGVAFVQPSARVRKVFEALGVWECVQVTDDHEAARSLLGAA